MSHMEILRSGRSTSDIAGLGPYVPDRPVQSHSLALKMRGRVIRDFQEQLYRYCGIRTFVLCTWTDETNTIRACGQEYNKYIDNGVDFKSMIRDWETAPLWNSWKRYSQRCFANAMHVPAPPASGKANHEPIMIELDREGCPLVPVIADYSQHHAKVIQGAVRDFLTLHLKDSLPTDLQLQDPSKMSKDDVQRLLDYWYEQEEAGIQPVEWKSTCPLLRDEPPHVSNIPRPVPRAQEPEAPLPSPQLPPDVLSQILTVLPLVEVLGAHGPFQRAPLPPCHPELVVHPQVHLWPIEAMKAHPTLVVAHHLSQQPQFLHGPFYTRSDSETVRADVVALTILHLYIALPNGHALSLALKDFAECILSLRAYLTWPLHGPFNSTRTVFLVMAALKTMFARSVLADGRPTHESCAETILRSGRSISDIAGLGPYVDQEMQREDVGNAILMIGTVRFKIKHYQMEPMNVHTVQSMGSGAGHLLGGPYHFCML
ncbi:hypothetical protein BC834DRAFT_847912 [Gloeopeniophorella convolvens]|nr:hypothetical protein BC834DRAFT_847912 [Gloeopeniophorella convolvens]